MKILYCSASFKESYGGPAVSVAALSESLSKIGHRVFLWAPDGSAKSHSGVVGLSGNIKDALKATQTVDIIHDSGIWLPHNHQLTKYSLEKGIARVVSTRGMLDPWARSHRRFKKAVAWATYQKRDLGRAKLLHATSDDEKRTLEALNLGPRIKLIPNGVELPRLARRVHPRAKDILFLGRLHPVKGLDILIDAWHASNISGWRLRIAGPDEGSYRSLLERRIRKYGLSDEILFLGPLSKDEKNRELQNCSLLVVPSRSESFGMVVAEALSNETPVLTTKAVPWPHLETERCGWRVPGTVLGIKEGILKAITCHGAEFEVMGRRGRQLIENEFIWDKVAASFSDCYLSIVRNSD